MPMSWVVPETFLSYKGVTVYHTYKDDMADHRLEFWFTTDYEENPDFNFDVRTLDGPGDAEERIKRAIDNDVLRTPEPEACPRFEGEPYICTK